MKRQADVLKWAPPFLVYALARDEKGRGLTADQIAASAGMSKRNVVRISQMLSWDAVKAGTIEAFMRGCNFTAAKQVDYIRKTTGTNRKFSHLSKLRMKSFEERIVAFNVLHESKKAKK